MARTCVTLWLWITLPGSGSGRGSQSQRSTQRTFGPWHFWAPTWVSFRISPGDRQNRGDSLGRMNRLSAGVRGGQTCQLPSSVCLSTEGAMGPRGCVRTTPRVSLQNSQPGQGHFGGRLWPARRARPLAYFRGPAPHRQLCAPARRRSMDDGPSLGKAVAHCLSSAPPGGSEQPGRHRINPQRLS